MIVPKGALDARSVAEQSAPRRWTYSILAGVALVALLALLMPSADVAAASDGYVDTDVLNLREAPGTETAVLAIMWQGEAVAIYDGPTDDGWYQVGYQGLVGWAYGGYLAVDGVSGWASGVGSENDAYAPSAAAERWIDFDRSSQTVTLFEGDTAVASYWGAIGWDGSSDGFFSTAIGTYYVYSKYAPLSWTDWGQTYISYWVGFDSSRSNGFHSYSMDASGNVLPNGAGATGGCIALDVGAAATLFDFTSIGTRVEVHW